MTGTPVADRKPDKKGKTAPPAAPPAKGKEEYTNSRLFEADAAILADLAAIRHTTVAALYRELFSETAKALLIEAAQERLDRLRGN